MTANQLAIVVAPPAFGLLLDLSQSYRLPLLIVAVLLGVVAGRTTWSLRKPGSSRR
jgi:hypothetical protein